MIALNGPPLEVVPAMTSKQILTDATEGGLERFPDFPPRDDMQNPIYLHRPTHIAALDIHFGNSPTTLVMGEVPVSWSAQREGTRIPDLLIAFDVDREVILHQRAGYSIDREGKAPDFALEVASPTTGATDITAKRLDYQRFGIPEYWRYDPSGGLYHGTALAGDRLVDGVYSPIEIEWLAERQCRGFSQVLGLYLCWEDGYLRWYNPETGSYLPTLDEETSRADREALRADRESSRADRETSRADRETLRADREAAARRQAEAETQRLRQRLEELGESD